MEPLVSIVFAAERMMSAFVDNFEIQSTLKKKNAMEKAMLYTDDTPLLWGEYKFIRLSRIPAQYLLSLHKNGKTHDKALLKYVDANKEILQLRLVGDMPTPAPSIPCKKRIYLTEIEAKKEIRRIRKLKQNRKKPLRPYECEACSGWHLTSLPLKVWLRRKLRS